EPCPNALADHVMELIAIVGVLAGLAVVLAAWPSLIDPLDVGRDRLFDQRVRAGVFRVGVAHPKVLPAFLADPADGADGEVRTVGRAGEAEGNFPVVIGSGPAARTGGAQEQALPGRQTPERGVINLAGELE